MVDNPNISSETSQRASKQPRNVTSSVKLFLNTNCRYFTGRYAMPDSFILARVQASAPESLESKFFEVTAKRKSWNGQWSKDA